MFDGEIKTTEYASLIVTHACNMQCVFCIDKYRGVSEDISMKHVIDALDVAKAKNIKEILIVGGEPTLHPQIELIALLIKLYGFTSILTTNYTNLGVMKQLDGIVDSFNISFYNQKELPKQADFMSDVTITTLIHKEQLETKEKLDAFINKYRAQANLKFSTLSISNEWTERMQHVSYLDYLPADKIILFDEIEGLVYRDCIIKRYDKVVNENAHQSIKFHVDGEISNSWDRNIGETL